MRRLWVNLDNLAIPLTLRANQTTLLGSLAALRLQANQGHKVNQAWRLGS